MPPNPKFIIANLQRELKKAEDYNRTMLSQIDKIMVASEQLSMQTTILRELSAYLVEHLKTEHSCTCDLEGIEIADEVI